VWHVSGTANVRTGFWWRDIMEREHLEDLGIIGKIILKLIFKKLDGEAWTSLLWLRIGAGGLRL